MAKFSKSIVIKAPVSKIFSYMNNPKNLPAIWPSMVEAREIQMLPNGGQKFSFVYKMAGVRLEGYSQNLEFVHNHSTVSEFCGGINGRMTLVYESWGPEAKVTMENEYRLPNAVAAKLDEALILKINEFEIEALLNNLKARMET